MSTFIGTATIMRHGPTKYTNRFPDLAEEALYLVHQRAREINARFPQTPIFISSPAHRARATALCVMEAYGLVPDDRFVSTHHLLRPIDIYNRPRISSFLETVTEGADSVLEAHRRLDSFFMREETFAQGELCETRLSAKNRLFEFLGSLPKACSPECHVVVVTHLELIGSAVRDWFDVGSEEFFPAETLHLFFQKDRDCLAEFRGKTRLLPF